MDHLIIKDKEEFTKLVNANKPCITENWDPIDYLPLLEGKWIDSNGYELICFNNKTISLTLESTPFFVDSVKASTPHSSDQPILHGSYALIGTIDMNSSKSLNIAIYLKVEDAYNNTINLSFSINSGFISSAGILKKKG